jgi:hypothetical protein
MMRGFVFATLLAAAGFTTSSAANAAVLVDTGMPNNLVAGDILGTTQRLAARFTLAHATTLTDVEGYFAGPAGWHSTIAILADGVGQYNSSVPVGDALYDTAISSTDGGLGWVGGTVSWALSAGTYWIVFGTGDTDNAPDGMVEASASPLPGAYWIPTETAGFIADNTLAFGVRISGDEAVSGGVPEPASWALMAGGMGLIGSSLRRRRTPSAILRRTA